MLNSKQIKSIVFSAVFIFGMGSCLGASEITYHQRVERDPFVALIGPNGQVLDGAEKVTQTDFVIEGIIFDPSDQSVVIINGEVYRAGDSIHKANIVQIYKDRVLLATEDEEKTIWLREEAVAEPSIENH